MKSFIDVDFTKDPNYVMGDLGVPIRGSLNLPRFSDIEEVIPESRWEEEIKLIEDAGGGIERFVQRIFNQGREGSCVANAFAQAHEVLQYQQYGKVVSLSPISLYKRIGRSPNSGAMVSDGLEEMNTRGILPLDTPENRAIFGDCVMPHTGYYTKYPSQYERVAKEFLYVETAIVEHENEAITCGIKGYPVVVGRNGHSIMYARPTYRSSNLVYGYPNSWDYSWGEPWGNMKGGFGFDSYRNIIRASQWAVCVRVVKARRI